MRQSPEKQSLLDTIGPAWMGAPKAPPLVNGLLDRRANQSSSGVWLLVDGLILTRAALMGLSGLFKKRRGGGGHEVESHVGSGCGEWMWGVEEELGMNMIKIYCVDVRNCQRTKDSYSYLK